MDASEQAAEQIVRMTLAGSEMVLRLTGTGAKNVAAGLMAAAASTERTKGKARLATMLKSGKELRVFQLKQEDLERFAQEAKRYGLLYTVVKPEDKGAPKLDVMARAEDASKINRILEKLGYGRVEEQAGAAVVREAHEPERESAPSEPQAMGADHEQANMDALAEILGAPPEKEADGRAVPLGQAPEAGIPSEPTSASSTRSDEAVSKTPDGRDRKSVKRDIEELRRQRFAKAADARAPKAPERQAVPPVPTAPTVKNPNSKTRSER